MARFLALTLLIGFFAFLPSAFANGESGLFCAATILFVLRLCLRSVIDTLVGCLVPYNTKQGNFLHGKRRGVALWHYANARHFVGNYGEQT